MNKQNNLSVVITGDNEKGKDLVAAIVSKSLAEHGFTNVTAINSIGEPMVNALFENVFDAVKATNPGLFSDPVRIWTSTHDPVREIEETVDNTATNGIPIDDPQVISDAIEADAATEEPIPA